MKGEITTIRVGLGGVTGKMHEVFLQDEKKKIEKRLISNNANSENPIVRIKEMPEVDVGGLSNLLRNKRNKNTIE